MHETLFISDLHLCEERPVTIALFEQFMATRACRAQALYLLGDIFEAWIGDDDPSPINAVVEQHIRDLVDGGVVVSFIHGNRDFLIARDFAARTGCRLLEDPTTVNLYGTPTLLTHGDRLCTDDVDYQAHRALAHTEAWKRKMLELPLVERIAMSREYRRASLDNNKQKPPEIMDVNEKAVAALMREHAVRRMIHGHTHRPAVHELRFDDLPAQRFVLAEWRTTGSVLCWNENGYWIESIVPRPPVESGCTPNLE